MSGWRRVTKKNRCPVCQKDGWCGFADDDPNVVICMREPSDKPTANGGWLHRLDEGAPARPAPPPPPRKPEPPLADFNSLWRRWREETDHFHLDGFAMSLGVSTPSLELLGCAWSGRAWAFPMRDERGEIVGVRLRDERGRKWAVKGSRQGLFTAGGLGRPECLYLVEGPTDCAAALTLGLSAVGRASCAGGEEMLAAFVRRVGARRVVIVADADEAGLRGGYRLKEQLRTPAVVWTPPCKDLREFVQAGGTAAVIEAATKDLLWGRAR